MFTLHAALGDGRPGDENAGGMGHRAMALVPGQMPGGRPELLAPQQGLALVAGMAEIERARHEGMCCATRSLLPP